MITAQELEYVRINLIHALADHSGGSKGLLVAFAENAMFTATARSRGRQKVADPATGRMVNPGNPPIPGQQPRARGSSIALIQPAEFSTASWRRAVQSLEEHQKAWLLWNYSENTCWDHQIEIIRWAWSELVAQIASKKIACKTQERLRALAWLAAQDIKAELAGCEVYQYKKLALLVGVEDKNWSKTFTGHWIALRGIFLHLDQASLLSISKTRSEQVAFNRNAPN